MYSYGKVSSITDESDNTATFQDQSNWPFLDANNTEVHQENQKESQPKSLFVWVARPSQRKEAYSKRTEKLLRAPQRGLGSHQTHQRHQHQQGGHFV
jgi:hypothetical protein